MNRKDLTVLVSEKTGLTQKSVNDVMAYLIDEIQERLAKGEPVKIQGLGTFETKARAPRVARDIVNGKPVHIPSKITPTFKPSKILKDRVERG